LGLCEILRSQTIFLANDHRAISLSRCVEFKKRRQLFIRVHNETFSVAAMRVSNEDRSPVGIHGCDTAPTPTGFAQIVSDYLPVLHAADSASFVLYPAMTK